MTERKTRGSAFLDRLERLLGNRDVSLWCFIFLVLRAGDALSFFDYLALAVIFINYSHKIEQIHAQVIEARRAATGTGAVNESTVGKADAPEQPQGASQ